MFFLIRGNYAITRIANALHYTEARIIRQALELEACQGLLANGDIYI